MPDSHADSAGGGFSCGPETDAERQLIRDQLDRLLASPLFSNSKRYPGLLKYIVEETLEGRASLLKERTLGVAVFGRDPAYDTNVDPVVRTSAVQVRHRVAQYYQEAGHKNELRIELLPGSYVPVFRNPDRAELAKPEVSAETVAAPAVAVVERTKRRIWTWALVALVLAGAAAVALRHVGTDPVTDFWGPVWQSSKPVVFCAPGKFPTEQDPTQSAGPYVPPGRIPGQPLNIVDSQKLNTITWPDATVLYTLVGFVQSHGKRYSVRRERDTTLSDVRGSSAVLIGGYNNQWLMRLASRYRFTYQSDADRHNHWIGDSQNPALRNWNVDVLARYSTFDEDYGIISRVWDASTEGWVVVASGIASYGTIAAGEFLVNPKYLTLIGERAPADWQHRNVQVVFSTRVFNGFAGPPRILAVHVW